MKIVIAIDGPAGAGKSTVAKIIADKLGLTYLDTGAMYRAIAWLANSKGFGPLDGGAVAQLAEKVVITFGPGNPQEVFLDEKAIGSQIRSSLIGQLASELSTHPEIRRVLVQKQKEVVSKGGVVLEGRDAATVVAPAADVKVYLTASLEERTRRRTAEFVDRGIKAEFDKVRNDIEQRDHRDITREESPLTVAPGAIVIDSANMSIEDVVSKVCAAAAAISKE